MFVRQVLPGFQWVIRGPERRESGTQEIRKRRKEEKGHPGIQWVLQGQRCGWKLGFHQEWALQYTGPGSTARTAEPEHADRPGAPVGLSAEARSGGVEAAFSGRFLPARMGRVANPLSSRSARNDFRPNALRGVHGWMFRQTCHNALQSAVGCSASALGRLGPHGDRAVAVLGSLVQVTWHG